MGKHRDWTEIRIDYEENGLSYTQLAEKYEVSISTMKKAAARQGWEKKKKGRTREKKAEDIETVLSKMEPPEMEPENGTGMAEIVPLYPDRVMPAETDEERFNRVVREMLSRVEDAICLMDVRQTGSVKLMTGALKDLKDLLGLSKTALDLEEQRARIEKLKSDTRIVESGEEYGVVMLPERDRVTPPE